MPETVFYRHRLLLLAAWAPSLEESWLSALLIGTLTESEGTLILIRLCIQIFQISTEVRTDQIDILALCVPHPPFIIMSSHRTLTFGNAIKGKRALQDLNNPAFHGFRGFSRWLGWVFVYGTMDTYGL